VTTSGLVLTLAADEIVRQRCMDRLAAHDDLELGPAEGLRLPVVLTTADAEHSERVTRALRELPGVDHLDIVFVGLTDGDGSPPARADRAGAARTAPSVSPPQERTLP